MARQPKTYSTIEGTVSSVASNGNACKLDGGDTWFSLSQYGDDKNAVIPAKGAKVRITYTGEKWIERIEPLSAGNAGGGQAPQNGYQAHQGAVSGPSGGGTDWEAKDQRIARQAVLNTATAILSSGGRPTTPLDVLKVASQLLKFVNSDAQSINIATLQAFDLGSAGKAAGAATSPQASIEEPQAPVDPELERDAPYAQYADGAAFWGYVRIELGLDNPTVHKALNLPAGPTSIPDWIKGGHTYQRAARLVTEYVHAQNAAKAAA